MPRRRSLAALVVTCSMVSACRLFLPIDPTGGSNSPSPESAPPAADSAAAPAPAAVAQPEPVPAQPTPSEVVPAPTPSPTPPTPIVVEKPAEIPAEKPVESPPPVAAPVPVPAPLLEPVAFPSNIGSVSDANIAAMLLASNYTDISYARLAPARAERADVRQFAQRMLADHTGVNKLLTNLLDKLDLAPSDNIISLDMRDESSQNRDVLRELSGYAFDSTYIENEVRYHNRFLAEIDQILAPKARNDELRSLVENVRPAVAAHLAHAVQLRAAVLSKK